MLVIRTGKEERMLTDRFGQGYRDYITRTGRFFPRIAS
jgi:protein-S-isoprenylcysteine O-methyltransferase Ste14